MVPLASIEVLALPVGSLPGRVLPLTSLEISKDMMLKYIEGLDIAESSLIILLSCELHVTVNFNHHSKYGVQLGW